MPGRRLCGVIFVLVLLTSLISIPQAGIASFSNQASTDRVAEQGAYFFAFQLPDQPFISEGVASEKLIDNQFRVYLARLLPILQDAVEQNQLKSFSPSQEDFGIYLVGAHPDLINRITQQMPIERIIPAHMEDQIVDSDYLAQRKEKLKRQVQTDQKPTTEKKESHKKPQTAPGKSDLPKVETTPSQPVSLTFPVLTPGHFNVHIPWNFVEGYTTTPSLPVTVNFWYGGVKQASGTSTSDVNGNYWVSVYTSQNDYYYSKPGDLVEVIETGGSTYSWTLPEFTARMYFSTSSITGIAPANSTITVEASLTSGYTYKEITASPDGSYSVGFQGETFLRNSGNGIHVADPVSQNQFSWYVQVGPTIQWNSNSGCQYIGSVGYAAQSVIFNLLSASRVLEETDTKSVNYMGWTCAQFNNASAQPGKIFQMVIPSGDVLEMTIANISAVGHPDLDTVTGTAPALRTVDVQLYSQKNHTWYSRYPTADSSGNFVADFSDVVDIIVEDQVGVNYYDEQNNLTTFDFSIPSLSAGHFKLQLPWSEITGYSTHPYLPITVNISRGGVLQASGSTYSDSLGYYWVYTYTSQGRQYRIKSGDLIEVIETGGSTYSWILPDFTARMFFSTTTISGSAPANATIKLDVSLVTGWANQETTASPEGTYAVSFATEGFRRNGGNWIDVYDPTSQNQLSWYMDVGPSVALNSSSSCQGIGSVGYAAQDATVNLLSSSRVLEESHTITADHTGSVCVYFENAIPLPGKIFQLLIPSGDILEMTIPNLSAAGHADLDTVTGTAPASQPVELQLYSRKNYENYYRNLVADSSGAFSADFSGQVDIIGGDYGWAIYYDPQHNRSEYGFRLPSISISITSGYIYGYIERPNTDVTINLKNSSGVALGSWQVTSGDNGYISQSFYLESPTYTRIFPQPGDVVEVIPAAGNPVIETIPLLTINADVEADIISGKALPETELDIMVCRETLEYSLCQVAGVVASASGDYQVSIPNDWGVKNGDEIYLENYTQTGNRFIKYEYLPNRLDVYSNSQAARVYTSPNTLVTLNVFDNTGTKKSTSSGTSSYYGQIMFYDLGLLSAGDVVEAVSAGVTTRMTIIPISITTIDRQNNLVEGTGPANTTLALVVRDYEFNNYNSFSAQVTTDNHGKFNVDLTGSYDLIGGNLVGIDIFDSANNQQVHLAEVPYVYVIRSSNRVYGYTGAYSPVDVAFKNSSGDLLWNCSTQASSSGYWSCTPPVVMNTGDVLDITTLGSTFSVTVPILTLTVDPAADTASGSAPALSYLYTYISGLTSGFARSGISSPDGSYSFTFAPEYDIKHLNNASTYLVTVDNDYVIIDYNVPGIQADETRNGVYGYAQPSSSVDLVIQNALGVKGSAAVSADSRGVFSKQVFCSGSTPVDIVPADTATARDYGSITVPIFTGTLDTAAEVISGTAPANAPLEIMVRNANRYLWGGMVTSTSGGTYSLNLAGQVDLTKGDFYSITWEDADGDRSYATFSTTLRSSLSAAFTSVPAGARPNAPVFLEWAVNGGVRVQTILYYDTVSHACDREYRFTSNFLQGSPGIFTGYLTAPAIGPIYVSAYAYVDGYTIWSPEVVIPVLDVQPVISDPVNGDTNTATPTLSGYASPGETIEFFEGVPGVGTPITLGSIIANDDATFLFTLPTSLSNGEHPIFGVADGKYTNMLNLTVDTSLLVDPNHIFFRDGASSPFRIRDDQGYARLGGSIWTRPDALLSISIPVACPDVSAVSVTAGANTTNLSFTGVSTWGSVWGGTFVHPNESFAVTANITCGDDPVQHILLTDGIIDPDGYVTDRMTGSVVPDAQVTLLSLEKDSSTYDVWDAATWGQVNPQFTDGDGFYRFYVPAGDYKLEVRKRGYYSFLSDVITVVNAPVRVNVQLDPWIKTYLPITLR